MKEQPEEKQKTEQRAVDVSHLSRVRDYALEGSGIYWPGGQY